MRSRLASSFVLAIAVLVLAPATINAATTTVECGQLVSYTAPDPVAPATGTLTIGLLPAWTIASDATLSAAVQANLASVAGTGPTCLEVDRDDSDVIIGLDFAATGSVSGGVVYDAALPGEIFANRLLIPTFITDAYPGLAAVFVTSQQAGTQATATFDVDTATGRFTGVQADAMFCGPVDLAGNGNGTVGAATIPASVLDAAATARLAAANGGHGCAEVHIEATIDGSGNLTLDTRVVITLAPEATPPNTTTQHNRGAAAPVSQAGSLAIVGLGGFVLVIALTRSARRRRRT